jgi:CubicO group peptidase (beta-lactamase class C family)
MTTSPHAAGLRQIGRFVFLTAGLLLAARLEAQQVPSALQPAVARIDAMAAEEHAKDKIGSVTVGIVHGAHLVWTRSYGDADSERRTPATKDTVYRIGSITKQFTGLMLMQLAQDGTVSFSDPVQRYLPELNAIGGRREGAPPITLLQLATMTSGIGREPANLPKYLVGPVSRWEQTLIAALEETKYDYEPGTRYFYSNVGYAILGAALSRAAKVPFTAHVEQRIFVPLGMTQTAFEPNAAILSAIAKGYQIDGSGRVSSDAPQREHAGRGYKVPNGAIYTTVGDLARFLAFELGEGPESVLKKAALREQQSRVGSANGRLDSGYGIGFQLARRGEHVFLGHSGSVAGYTAQAWIHPASKTGLIVLRNAAGGKFELSGFTFRALTELANAGTPVKTSAQD